MDFFEAVEKRRSVRKFTDKEVPEEIMRKCLKAATLAPNSSNLQPWEFYWVRNSKNKNRLSKLAFHKMLQKQLKKL